MKLSQINFPDPYGTTGTESKQSAETITGIPSVLQDGSIMPLIQMVTNWLFYLGITFAVVYVMYAGISWITSQGDAPRIAEARKRLIFAVLGLIVVLSAFLIVRLIIFTIGGNPDRFLDPESFFN